MQKHTKCKELYIAKHFKHVAQCQWVVKTTYVLLSFILPHFYPCSTVHISDMTETRLNLFILIAIQRTCFPLTNTVVMKGLMLSTVWWSRLLQYRTATQYRKQPAWWYKFFRWSSTATITQGNYSSMRNMRDNLHWSPSFALKIEVAQIKLHDLV